MDSVDEVLAGLREQREKLTREQEKLAQELARVEKAIAALEGSLGESRTAAAAAPAVPPYAYLTLYEAVAHYLSTEEEPRTSSEIAAALRAGGFKTRSRRLAATVVTMLSRKEAHRFGIQRTPDRKRWTSSR